MVSSTFGEAGQTEADNTTGHVPDPRLHRFASQVFWGLLVCVGVLIHSCTERYPRGSLASCRELGLSGTSSSSRVVGGPGRSPKTGVLSRCSSCVVFVRLGADPPTGLASWPGPSSSWAHVRWTHFGSIRGTPCSTVAIVAPGHGPGGSCSSCRGYDLK